LAREFRRHYGCTVTDYIRHLRIEFACRELLVSNASVVDIALRAGFADHSHLARTLRKDVGMSPTQFRSTHAAR
jgi:AraC family transcriptional regulator